MNGVRRNLGNFATMPLWNCIFTKKQIEELIDISGDWIICNGSIRDFVFNKITDDRIKVSTKKRVYI